MTPKIQAYIAKPSTKTYAIKILDELLKRDAVDALHVLEELTALLQDHVAQIEKQHSKAMYLIS